jgi:hypothetical protein
MGGGGSSNIVKIDKFVVEIVRLIRKQRKQWQLKVDRSIARPEDPQVESSYLRTVQI